MITVVILTAFVVVFALAVKIDRQLLTIAHDDREEVRSINALCSRMDVVLGGYEDDRRRLELRNAHDQAAFGLICKS